MFENDKLEKKCKTCGLPKPIKYFYIYRKSQIHWDMDCALCVSQASRAKRYKDLCENCGAPSKVDDNKNCRKCNKTAGLYQCRSCSKLLPLDFAFDGRHRQCKWCLKVKRKIAKSLKLPIDS